MAPILSISKEHLDSIRDAVSPSVVSIWEQINEDDFDTSCRSGFVFEHCNDACVVITLSEGLKTVSKGLSSRTKIFVCFENGYTVEGSDVFCQNQSRLAAIVVRGFSGLTFVPKKVVWSPVDAKQCDAVVHMGFFGKLFGKVGLNFSSGSVGLVGHRVLVEGEEFTRFFHCCSQKQYLLGAPVFNLFSQGVGVNFSKKAQKNMFFAMDLEQLGKELTKLLGENSKDLLNVILGVTKDHEAKKRKMPDHQETSRRMRIA